MCLRATATPLPFSHIIGEVLPVVEADAVIASIELSGFCPGGSFGGQKFDVRWWRNDGSEIASRESQVDFVA
jgi:hypothetical protein